MSKHTPGPWEVSTDERMGIYFLEGWANHLSNAHVTEPDAYDACNEANADLMAAAPTMWEAIEWVDAEIELLALAGAEASNETLKVWHAKLAVALVASRQL